MMKLFLFALAITTVLSDASAKYMNEYPIEFLGKVEEAPADNAVLHMYSKLRMMLSIAQPQTCHSFNIELFDNTVLGDLKTGAMKLGMSAVGKQGASRKIEFDFYPTNQVPVFKVVNNYAYFEFLGTQNPWSLWLDGASDNPAIDALLYEFGKNSWPASGNLVLPPETEIFPVEQARLVFAFKVDPNSSTGVSDVQIQLHTGFQQGYVYRPITLLFCTPY